MTATDASAALAAIRARAEAATGGPWLASHNITEDTHDVSVLYSDGIGVVIADCRKRADDALFIAHAREDVPRMAAALDAVLALCDEARGSLGLPPIDCSNACGDGPCDCSGITRTVAWSLDPARVRAAITDALGGGDG